MDGNGNLYASQIAIPGKLHHSSFLGGLPVAGAGEIIVKDGRLVAISRSSGHYRPSPEHLQRVVSILEQQGIDVSKLHYWDGF